MDFARKQLEKYGWSAGKGLGAHEDGIREPIKPHLKRSTACLGYNAGKDFTDHWWNKLYDKASQNILVETKKNGVTKNITVKDPDAVELTNRTWTAKKKKKENSETAINNDGYMKHFVKKAVLTSNRALTKISQDETSDSSMSDDDDDEKAVTDVKESFMLMSDEALFAACGGRTAHKGARHGLRATGKLARVEQQEALLLQHSRFDGYSHKTKLDEENKVMENKDTKEIKVIEKQDITNGEVDAQNEIQPEIVSKKKKSTRNEISQQLNQCDTGGVDNSEIIYKKKKRKVEKEIEECKTEKIQEFDLKNTNGIDDSISKNIEKKSKKKNRNKERKKEEILELDSTDLNGTDDSISKNSEKKSKKKKRKAQVDVEVDEKEEIQEFNKIGQNGINESESSD